MFARRATSSRRRPGARRRRPARSPTTSGDSASRRWRRKSASAPRVIASVFPRIGCTARPSRFPGRACGVRRIPGRPAIDAAVED